MNATSTVKRLFSVLAVTLGLFCVYYFILTPNIEPPILQKNGNSEEEGGTPPPKTESPYAGYFPEGAWERTIGIENHIKSDNIVMLFQTLSINDKMCVRSGKCSILFAPGKKSFPMQNNPEKPFHPIIISILGGAEIQFQEGGNQLSPRLREGTLNGKVTVNYKVPVRGHFLNCTLETSDVVCNMRSLQTSKTVTFKFGDLTGEGKQLNLSFNETAGESNSFSGVRKVQLNHVNHITFKVTPFLLQQMNHKFSDEMLKRLNQMLGEKMEFPVVLTCDGPMEYEVETGNVTFTQNVKISCNYSNLPPDTLMCDKLTIQLTSDVSESLFSKENLISTEETTPANNTEIVTATPPTTISVFPQESDKEIPIKNIKAHQNVRLSIPTFDVIAQADSLEFSMPDQKLSLSGNQQANIKFGQYEFHANDISYTFPPNSKQKFGTVKVDKNGWFRTYFANPQQPKGELLPLTLHWEQGLSTKIVENDRYLSEITGKVELQTPEIGKLTSKDLSCQLRFKTPAEEQQERTLVMQLNRLNPHKPISYSTQKLFPEWIKAENDVKIHVKQDTVQLQAALEEIYLQFEPAKEIPRVFLPSQTQNTPNSASPMNTFLNPRPLNAHGSNQPAKQRHFILKNAKLQGKIQLLPGEKPFYISQISLSETNNQNFHLYEDSFLNSDKNISLQAKNVNLYDLHPNTLQCEINGSPALLTGFGVQFASPKITVNCAANRIDINNAGEMHVSHPQLPHSDSTSPSKTIVKWSKSLNFDGQIITAQDNVRVMSANTIFCADTIKALLSEPIQLNNPPKIDRNNPNAELDFFANISAEQNVILTHRKYDQGQVVDVFTLKTQFANFHPGTMDLLVSGKGSLRLSHFGSIDINAPKEPSSDQSPEWFQIFVEYIGGISGNLTNGEFSIKKQISAIAHGVPDPGFHIPNSRIAQREIPDKGFQFTCDEIYINQVPTFQPGTFKMLNAKESHIELQAQGNVHMENRVYTIDGNKLKYSQSKNTCSIQGTPRIPVRITKQELSGGTRHEMNTESIEINLKSMRYNMDGIRIDGAL